MWVYKMGREREGLDNGEDLVTRALLFPFLLFIGETRKKKKKFKFEFHTN